MFLADLRIRSNFTGGKLSVPEIVDLYGSKGFGAIAITDPIYDIEQTVGRFKIYSATTLTPAIFPIYREILRTEAARAWDEYRMVLLTGIEVVQVSVFPKRASRIVGLGIAEYIPARGDAPAVARAIRKQGGVAIATGIESNGLWGRRRELATELDAWEVNDGRNLLTDVFASELPKLAASGMSSREGLSSWKSLFFCDRHPDAILGAIRRQDLSFMYYDEVVSDDLRSGVHLPSIWNDDRALGLHDRGQSLRHLALPPAFSKEALGLGSEVRAGLHFEAAQGSGSRPGAKPRELLPVGVSRV